MLGNGCQVQKRRCEEFKKEYPALHKLLNTLSLKYFASITNDDAKIFRNKTNYITKVGSSLFTAIKKIEKEFSEEYNAIDFSDKENVGQNLKFLVECRLSMIERRQVVLLKKC